MRFTWKSLLAALGLVVFSVLGTIWVQMDVVAQDNDDTPVRQTEIIVSYTEYQWWLARWSDNQITCTVLVEHEGIPTNLEVLASCGQVLYDNWVATPPCAAAAEENGFTENCSGMYLFFVTSRPKERTVVVDLPVPSIFLNLEGCELTPPDNRCSQIPALVFRGLEPLPNEQITALHIRIDDVIYDCPGSACQIPMSPTSLTGVDIEFWADSSFGDESDRFTARVRIVDGGVSSTSGDAVWFVDVISSQWQGTEPSSCAATWEAFLPLGGPPQWLTTPADSSHLASDTPFIYLAGQLISAGIVDASTCAENGLLPNGAANICGLEAALSVVNDWQDHFDSKIIEVSEDTTVPAQLMKNLFAQESQFWPGEIIAKEFGLGQLTSLGTDGPLLWNPTFFNQFCPLVLHEESCEGGYSQLEAADQAILRGALASQTNATCSDCEFGIDLTHAEFTIGLFAETLLGNCEQVAYIVHDITGQSPGTVSTYEDLWRYTLANYNAGPGCLISAMQTAQRQEGVLNWQTVSTHMSTGCQGAITYVDRITRDRQNGRPDFLPTPTVLPTGTPLATATLTGPYPAVTATPSGGAYPAATSTPSGGAYPVVTPTPTDVAYPAGTPTPTANANLVLDSVPQENLAPVISKSFSESNASPGDTIVIVNVISNDTSQDFSNVVIKDVFPNFIELLDVTASRGRVSLDYNTNTVSFDIGKLLSSKSVELHILGRISEVVPLGSRLCNFAEVVSETGSSRTPSECVTILPAPDPTAAP